MRLPATYIRATSILATEPAISSFLVFAGILIALIQLAEPVLFGWVVDALAKADNPMHLIAYWAGLGFVGIMAGVTVAVQADRLAHRLRLKAMDEAFERALMLPISYHSQRGSGAVIGAVLRGTDELFWLWLGTLREQLPAIVGILLLAPLALAIDARMTAILVVLAVIYATLNLYVVSRTSRGQAEVEAHRYHVSGRIGDVLGNVAIVQSYARFAAEVDAMRTMMTELLNAQYPVLTWWGALTILQRSAATIAMVLIFAVGAYLASLGELSIGEIVTFVAFANLLIGRLDQLSAFVIRIQQATPAIQNYFALIDEATAMTEHAGAEDLVVTEGEINYRHVTYQFEGTSQGVFDISFTARRGQTIALVGATGSGKTTALALLQRLRTCQQGTIEIDGQDIARVTLKSLRNAIAVVFQDAGLFNRTIAENIRIGRPSATDDEVVEAARIAQAHDFVVEKPGGYDFVIGERGTALSGGERQRIAIARALLKNAPILVLDEATSALDTHTENLISSAIDALRLNRTTIVVAHRLSTVTAADMILVLDKGRIVERGTFEELAGTSGLFARMVRDGGFAVPKQDKK